MHLPEGRSHGSSELRTPQGRGRPRGLGDAARTVRDQRQIKIILTKRQPLGTSNSFVYIFRVCVLFEGSHSYSCAIKCVTRACAPCTPRPARCGGPCRRRAVQEPRGWGYPPACGRCAGRREHLINECSSFGSWASLLWFQQMWFICIICFLKKIFLIAKETMCSKCFGMQAWLTFLVSMFPERK